MRTMVELVNVVAKGIWVNLRLPYALLVNVVEEGIWVNL